MAGPKAKARQPRRAPDQRPACCAAPPADVVLPFAEAKAAIEGAARLRERTRGDEHCNMIPWEDMSEEGKVGWILLYLRTQVQT